jgi:hypothetical protein
MANKKLSGLTELAETPASGDMVPVVDVSDTTGAATGTTKKVSVDNLISEIAVADMAASAVVLESEGISSNDNDTTLPTSAAVKDYVDTQLTAEDLDFQGDSGGALAIDLDSETLTIAGGTGIDTVGSSNTVTASIDSTVATLTGSQTLTNKTLTSPVIDTGVSGTAIKDEDTMSSDSATHICTQQSIKAYVDSASGAGEANQNAWSTITVPAGTTSQAADTATDSVAFTAAGGMTITGGADDTIEFSSADTNTNQLTTFTLNGTTATTPTTVNHGDTITIAAGTGITTTSTSDGVVTVASTVTDTNTNQLTTFTVSATTDTTATTISQGDDLFFAAGTGITCETTADGTVTVASTVTDTNTTYTAGDGLTLTGTDFDLSVSELTDISGTGDVSGWSAGDTVAIVDSGDSNASKRIKLPAEIGIACSDETTAITVGNTAADTQKASILIPRAMTVTEIKCNLYKKDSSTVTVDVNYHATAPESAVTLLNNPASDLSMATTALTASTGTFASAATSYVLAENSFVTVDVDAAGTNALGLKVWLLGYWT